MHRKRYSDRGTDAALSLPKRRRRSRSANESGFLAYIVEALQGDDVKKHALALRGLALAVPLYLADTAAALNNMSAKEVAAIRSEVLGLLRAVVESRKPGILSPRAQSR